MKKEKDEEEEIGKSVKPKPKKEEKVEEEEIGKSAKPKQKKEEKEEKEEDEEIGKSAKPKQKEKEKEKEEEEEEIGKSAKPKPKKDVAPGRLIDTYAAQCGMCHKWRVIDSQDEYEDIRSKMCEEPFVCEKKHLSCEDPADIDYDSSRTWVIDKPGVPKTPKGYKRSLVLRKDYSKMDTYYITPTGKKLRSRNEIASFVEANPEFNIAPLGDFSFAIPKVMEDTVPLDIKFGSPLSTTTTNSEKSSHKQIQG